MSQLLINFSSAEVVGPDWLTRANFSMLIASVIFPNNKAIALLIKSEKIVFVDLKSGADVYAL